MWIGLPMELDAEFVRMTPLRPIRRQRSMELTSWFGSTSAILANSAS